MGDQYIRSNGTWTKANRPYVKINGVWTPAVESWVKRSGSWTLSWFYNATPPSIPEMSLRIVDNRYISVGLRLPDAANNPRLKRIRVLASRTTAPTSQFGSGEITGNSVGYPTEDWSNWYYNHTPHNGGHTEDHGPSNVFTYKYYPLNPTSATNLPGGQYYSFGAWSEDVDGNWSAGMNLHIWMPKNGTPAVAQFRKEANITADAAGTLLTGSYSQGLVRAHNSPRNDGVFFHGTTFNDLVGIAGAPTVGSAKIRLSRSNDTGQSAATVRLGWHSRSATAYFDPTTAQDVTVVGTIQKGETKWFDLPTSWYSRFNTQLKGIVLVHGGSATDDLELNDLGTDARNGEVDLGWTEAL